MYEKLRAEIEKMKASGERMVCAPVAEIEKLLEAHDALRDGLRTVQLNAKTAANAARDALVRAAI